VFDLCWCVGWRYVVWRGFVVSLLFMVDSFVGGRELVFLILFFFFCDFFCGVFFYGLMVFFLWGCGFFV